MRSSSAFMSMVEHSYRNFSSFLEQQRAQESTARRYFELQLRIMQMMLAGGRPERRMLPGQPEEFPLAGRTEPVPGIDPIRRLVPVAVAAEAPGGGRRVPLPQGSAVLVLERTPSPFPLVERVLADFRNPIYHVTIGRQTRMCAENHFEADFSSFETVAGLRRSILERSAGICAVFNMTAWPSSPFEEHLRAPLALFRLLKVFLPDLKKSIHAGGAWLVNFSFMDGRFGFSRSRIFPLGQAGSVGLAKAVAREVPKLAVKCVDVDPDLPAASLVARLGQELSAFGPETEAGFSGAMRWKIELRETESPSVRPIDGQAAPLGPEAVLLLTGGGYGIVAEAAKALSLLYCPRIIIVGRSPLPSREPQETRNLAEPADLVHYLAAAVRPQERNPARLLAQARRILRNRQIRANLERMAACGAEVSYLPLDVRDADAFGRLIDSIYSKYGRLDGVIHGAGVIEDKLVESKTDASFQKVFDTKVVPALVLKDKLRPQNLRFLCFFSSVAARFGNRGQSDYCAANEVLNKLAGRLSMQWRKPVFAINWGPWEGGMVTPEMRGLFASRGVPLLPVEAGVSRFLQELQAAESGQAEVLITRRLNL